MAAKGVYVSLRMGVDRATLPDNRAMKAGAVYLISVDDFQKLSRSVRESVVVVNGIEDKARVVSYSTGETGYQFIDLEGYSDGSDNDIASMGWKVGKVLQGLNGEAFKLVKVVDDDCKEGDALVWFDKASAEAGKGQGEFAGVLVGDTDENNFGWIQTEGIVTAASNGDPVSAGDNVTASALGTFETAAGDGDTVGTALTAGGSASLIEVALRSTRARNRYVKRPNLFYPGQ